MVSVRRTIGEVLKRASEIIKGTIDGATTTEAHSIKVPETGIKIIEERANGGSKPTVTPMPVHAGTSIEHILQKEPDKHVKDMTDHVFVLFVVKDSIKIIKTGMDDKIVFSSFHPCSS